MSRRRRRLGWSSILNKDKTKNAEKLI